MRLSPLLSTFRRRAAPVLAACATLLAAQFSPYSAQAAFDPVNDDTDIFLTNPDIVSQRPNVLLVLDNTANWNSAFDNEKSALVSVVNNLTDQYNLGLMMFPETGGGNDSVDGGFLRYSIRQMTSANKTVLSSIVNNLDKLNDKGNNATLALNMMEAYRYFSGNASRASHGKIKTDMSGQTTHEAYIAGIGGQHLSGVKGTAQDYTTPIADGCQKNFIIYISNGPANENASALSTSETELTGLLGSAPGTIALSPNGQQGNWADEWANYMANNDVNTDVPNTQNVITYTVEVDPVGSGQGPAMTALLQSMASKGKGKYFSVTSGSGGSAIVNALNQIFQEVQSVNSVFTSVSLPVSVNVRGTSLDQVYVGVFRPDSAKAPRWFGNLKMYRLKADTNGDIFLADQSGSAAYNAATGFAFNTATSYWTSGSSFWSYRSSEQNSVGGNSDSPDGEIVEKGAAAYRLRTDLASDQSGRKLYTCTGACTSGGTAAERTLSNYPFATTNTDVDAAALGLGTKDVSSLTGLVQQTLTSLTDTWTASSMSAASAPVSVTLSNGSVTKAINTLTSNATRTLTALDNGANSKTISSGTKNQPSAGRYRITTSAAHGFSNTTTFISGMADSDCNSASGISIANATGTTFDFATPAGCNSSSGGTATQTSTSVTATAANHGFTAGQSVTLAGITPSGFNGSVTIGSATTNTFTFSTASPLAAPSVLGTATSATTTAIATITAGHGYTDGQSVTISGAVPSGFNGSYNITYISPTQFSFTVASPLGAATTTGNAVTGSTTVTATSAGAHGFNNNDSVTISGASPADYNGAKTITTLGPGSNTFTYTTATPLAPASGTITASGGAAGNLVTVSLAGHPFANGDSITVSGAVPADYNGSYTVSGVTANSFQYTLPGNASASSTTTPGSIRFTTPKAVATLAGHGYGNGDSIVISGATPSGYNATYSIQDVTTDTFRIPLGSALNSAATGTIKAGKASTTAYATAANHGFSTGANITISGASPSAFNGTYAITATGTDTFTYTLGSAQGAATGSITASDGTSGAGSERDAIINWLRGADNEEDENANSSTTDVRASIHADVLHSRPSVINYNRYGDDNDIYVFYGANGGVLHAVKGGYAATSDGTTPGTEVWGFVAPEHFSNLKRLRNNEPILSSSNKKPYFFDGSISSYAVDANGDGKFKSADGDKVYLYVTARRGGRLVYALDVSDPEAPKLLWKRSNFNDEDSNGSEDYSNGWAELGYTWSTPVVTTVNAHSNPVLIFGAGYDPTPEDVDPSTITSSTASTISAGAATYSRSMGRGIFVVDAFTGELIWQAGPSTPAGITHTFKAVSGMDYAIPGDAAVIRSRTASVADRIYIGDTGGNVWRVDIGDASEANWKVSKLASIGGTAPTGLRKFLHKASVVYGSGYDAVLLGTGDREHPFDTTVQNRFYMFKDFATGSTAYDVDGTTLLYATIGESDLYNATSDNGLVTSSTTTTLASKKGWLVTFGDSGEKTVTDAITFSGTTIFSTNSPQSSSSSSSSCTSSLGTARTYFRAYDTAGASLDVDNDGDIDSNDLSTTTAGGGYLPSSVISNVQPQGGDKVSPIVCTGLKCSTISGDTTNQRTRKFSFKKNSD